MEILQKLNSPVMYLICGTIVLFAAVIYYVIRYRIIDPWPAKFWCPWLARDEVQHVNTIDTIKILQWFRNR